MCGCENEGRQQGPSSLLFGKATASSSAFQAPSPEGHESDELPDIVHYCQAVKVEPAAQLSLDLAPFLVEPRSRHTLRVAAGY